MSATAALAEAAEAVQALAAADWSEVPEADLPAAAVLLERMQAQLDAIKLANAARLEETDAAARHGWASTKDFLTHVAGGRKGAGGGMVRLARRLRALPATQAALADGTLSKAKAQVIAARVAQLPRVEEVRAAAEELFLAKAADLDATDLDNTWHQIVGQLDPDGALLGQELSLARQERAAHRFRFLAFTGDEFGGVRIRGYATAEDVELVKAALMPLSAPVRSEPGSCGGSPGDPSTRSRPIPCADPECHHDGSDQREFGARLWDALVEACRLLQTTRVLPDTHTAPPRLFVTTTLEDLQKRLSQIDLGLSLAGEPTSGSAGIDLGGLLPGGRPLSVSAVRRLACDAEVIPFVLGSESQVLDVGRAQRFVTPAIWHALVARDQHCAFPGCRRLPQACDAHHVVHWADGGRTSLDNLVLVCRRHHTAVHHTAWTLAIDPANGRPVWTPPPELLRDSGRLLPPRGDDAA